MDTVLIPAYEPDSQLIPLTMRLQEAGFTVVVVDDGSGKAYEDIFSQVRPFAHIVTHKKNRGKGAALKTGMLYIQKQLPQSEHFITCDADGQHRVEDVIRVQQRLHQGHNFVLTIRSLDKDIPLRSKVGNLMSRVVYTLLTKRYLSDNQSGLRGFSCSYIPWLVKIPKDNYDYEMNVLYYAAKKAIPISTVNIDAIYINNNASSHFHPIKDTVRIYQGLFGLAIGQFIGLASALVMIMISSLVFGYQYVLITVPLAGLVSYGINILVNRLFVFRKVRCYDHITLLFYQIVAYFLYTLGCILVYYALPWLPMWAAFGGVFLLCLPLRYWLHKFTFIALRTRE